MITIKNTHTNKSITFDSTGTYILNEEDLGFIAGTHNTTKALGQRGEYITSTVLESRDISITGYILAGNIDEMEIRKADIIELINPLNDIEIIKGEYKIECKPISTVKFSTNYKENNEYECKLIISVFCANPFWKSLNEIKSDIALWKGMFHFPLVMPSTIIPHSGTDSTWKDLSGNLNNGLLSGFSYDTTSGWTTEGLKFDNDSYVTLPSLDIQEGTIQVNNQVVTFDKDTDYSSSSVEGDILSLNTTVDGVMDVELGGNTLQNLLPKVQFLDTAKTYSTASTVSVSLVHEPLSMPMIKPNTVYTVILKINYANKTAPYNYFQINYKRFDGTSVSLINQAIVYPSGSLYKIKVTTEANIKELISVFLGGKEGSIDILTGGYCILLEGDWTNKELPYFEGIRSVGESENLELISCGKNLFNNDTTLLKKGFYFSATGIYTSEVNSVLSEFYIKIDSSKNYVWNGDNKSIIIMTYDVNKNVLERLITYSSPIINTIKFKENVKYVRIASYQRGFEVLNNFQLEEGTTQTTYEPYQEHRQPITLTNPLRGLPNNVRDIAKGNVLTRNVGKVVLNGGVSENWNIDTNKETTNTMFFFTDNPLIIKSSALGTCMSDRFNNVSYSTISVNDADSISTHPTVSRICIRISKSKLTTPDVAGFKAWLQANLVTVYYQLATPTTENLAQALKLKSFANGTLQVNTLMPPYLSAYYPISLGGSLASNVSRIDLSNPLITGLVKNYRVYDKILTTEEIARANTTNYLRGPSLLVDLNSAYKELTKTGIIMGYKEPSLIVNIDNDGSVEIGMIIEFRAKGTLSNPSLFNVNTREQFKIEKNMVAGEKFVINTNFGKKKVEHYLNGVKSNGFKYIKRGSTFLQLLKGSNLFRYDADTNLNNLEVAIYYIPCYLGVV